MPRNCVADSSIGDWDPRLGELIAVAGVEQGAIAYLEEVRWPGGISCPRCASTRVGFMEARKRYFCRNCSYQFRATVGTVLHHSHIPVATWLMTVGLMLHTAGGCSALQLKATIGGSYKTAWFIEHRVRAAIAEALKGNLDTGALGENRTSLSRIGLSSSNAALRMPGVRSKYLDAHVAEARWRAEYKMNASAFRMAVEALVRRTPVQFRALTRDGSNGHRLDGSEIEPRSTNGRLTEVAKSPSRRPPRHVEEVRQANSEG